MANKKRLVVVGGGRVGSALIADLPETWELAVVDVDPAALALLPRTCLEAGVRCVTGDATSRLTLDSLNLRAHCTVAVVTGNDTVNREVARLLRQHYGVEELVVLLDDVEDLEEIGLRRTDVIERSTATATLVRNRLFITGLHGVPLGLGGGEILELTILEGSPAAGRSLMELQPRRWLVAAVYRDDVLIVPHGNTCLQAHDRVLIVGPPEVVESVGAFLRGGEPVFPTQFGPNIGMVQGCCVEEEAQWLSEASSACTVVAVGPHLTLSEPDEGEEDLATTLSEHGVGCFVLEPRKISLAARLGLTQAERKRFVVSARVPVLVSRGSHPYRRILLAVGRSEQVPPLAGLAIDLAQQFDAELSVLTVRPPTLSEVSDGVEILTEIPKHISRLASMRGIQVHRIEERGNPIEVIRRVAAEHDLLIVGHSVRRRHSLIVPDVSLFLLHKTPCSVMFVPWKQAGG